VANLNRREFLGTTAALSAGIGAGLTALSSAVHVSGADEKAADRPAVRLAVMGVNSRGKQLLQGFTALPNAEIAYICDPDSETIPAAMKVVTDKGRKPPKIEKDFRKALDDREVDALVVAAPDHWHALAAIWGCQAGKDVYVEKPVSHNPAEGKRIVEAARRYKRIVQGGTQRRSSTDLAEAVKLIKGGKLGDVNFVRAWITSQRPNIGHNEVSAAPENLDFDLWCGPAPNHGYKKNLVHYNWHWRWDYGTGECGNNGIHALDVARWGLGVEFPEYVTCGGGKNFFDDDQETPDTQLATFDCGGTTIQWEHRTWSPRGIDGEAYGVVFYGSEATLVCKSSGWKLYAVVDKKEKEIETGEPNDYNKAHLENFLDCVGTRELPNADIEIAHRSTQFCQLANIAWRTRSTLKYDAQTESIVDNPAATALLSRSYRQGFELPVIG